MNISADPMSSHALPSNGPNPGRRTAAEFERIMSNLIESGGPNGVASKATRREAQAQEAAEQLVSTVFVQPVLAMARDSEWGKTGMFAPGAAERRFGPMLDQRIAEHIVQGSNFPLVDQVRNQMFGEPSSPSRGEGRTRRSER